jgi:hypothetical protein
MPERRRQLLLLHASLLARFATRSLAQGRNGPFPDSACRKVTARLLRSRAHLTRGFRTGRVPCEKLQAAAPARDGVGYVGRDACHDVGRRVEEPLQPDAVEHSVHEAHFLVDLGVAKGCDVAGGDGFA